MDRSAYHPVGRTQGFCTSQCHENGVGVILIQWANFGDIIRWLSSLKFSCTRAGRPGVLYESQCTTQLLSKTITLNLNLVHFVPIEIHFTYPNEGRTRFEC